MENAIYIKHNGRGWAVWPSPHDGGFRAIPEDEEEFDDTDLMNLARYLHEEGFTDTNDFADL